MGTQPGEPWRLAPFHGLCSAHLLGCPQDRLETQRGSPESPPCWADPEEEEMQERCGPKVWTLLLRLPCRPGSFSRAGTCRKPCHPWGPDEDLHLVEGDRKKAWSREGAARSHPGLRPLETSRPLEQCSVTEKPPPQA